MGLFCAPVGLVAGIAILLIASAGGYEFFILAAPLAAFLTGYGMWWLLIERPEKLSRGRGALAGALAGFVAHYLCWYILILFHNVCYHVLGRCVDSLNEGPIDPLNGLWGALVFSLMSLLFLGIFTVGLGGLIGYFFARSQEKS